MIGKNLFWDSCVFIRYITRDDKAPHYADICRFVSEAKAGKRSLAALIDGKRLTIERHGRDRYGRTLAYVWSNGANLSCVQIRRKMAVYVPKWNTGGRGC